MNLTSTQVHLYFFSLALPEPAKAQALALLSPAEQARAAQFRFPHHRDSFIAAHAKLRNVLATYQGSDPAALVFETGVHGKPALLASEFTFNLAHSHDFGLIAVGKKLALGVDIEKYQDKAKLDVAERFFSVDEVRYLHSLSEAEQKQAFYHVWAKKESVVKAIGTGIQQSLTSFTVPLSTLPGDVIIENQTWRVRTLNISPDFAAALATHPSVTDVLVQK